MQNKFLRGFLSILGSKIFTLFFSVLITPLLVRILGSTQYGDYAFLLSLLGITMILVNAGIFDGARKYIAENRESDHWVENVFSFYLRIGIVFAGFASLTYACISWFGFAERAYDSEFAAYFTLLGGLILIRQVYSIIRGALMGLGLEARSEPLQVLQKAAFGIIGLSLAYIGYGISGVLVGQLIASLIVTIFATIILFKHLNLRIIFTPLPEDFPKRELFSFNGLSVVFILLTSSLYHVDILLLRSFSGSQATGYYRAALVIAEFLWFVPNSLQTVLLHSSSEMWSKNQTNQITTLASKVTRYNLSLVLILTIGLSILADDFVPLYYGPEFERSIRPLLLLLPGALGFALARPIFAVGQGQGALRVLIVATGAAAIMNACLNLLLIPQYGMSGAAIATSLSYGSMVVFHILAAHRIGFDPIDDLRLRKIIIVSILSLSALHLMDTFIRSSIYSILLIPPVGFIIYLSLSLRVGVIAPNEFNEVLARAPPSVAQRIDSFLGIFR